MMMAFSILNIVERMYLDNCDSPHTKNAKFVVNSFGLCTVKYNSH